MKQTIAPTSAGLPASDPLHHPLADVPVINLDMDAIYNTARTTRAWALEFNDSGVVFKWAGKATSQAAAEFKARAELSEVSHNFNRYKARLVAAVEVQP